MNKFHALKQLRANGDSVVYLKDNTGVLATTDFSAKYIKDKKYGRFTMAKGSILVFSWTDDRFKNIDTNDITRIQPLSAILRNTPPEVLNNG